jgi:hypothetical protein
VSSTESVYTFCLIIGHRPLLAISTAFTTIAIAFGQGETTSAIAGQVQQASQAQR